MILNSFLYLFYLISSSLNQIIIFKSWVELVYFQALVNWLNVLEKVKAITQLFALHWLLLPCSQVHSLIRPNSLVLRLCWGIEAKIILRVLLGLT